MAQIFTFEKARPAYIEAIALYVKNVKKRLAVISVERGWPLRNVDDFANRLYIVMLVDRFWLKQPLAYRNLGNESMLTSIEQSFVAKMIEITSAGEVPSP